MENVLSWEQAEAIVGRSLDIYNNYDCCLYEDLVIEKLKEAK